LPLELYVDIFKAINTFPIKFENNSNKKEWREYAQNLLTSSRIIYITINEVFYATKIIQLVKDEVTKQVKEEVTKQLQGFKEELKKEIISELKTYFDAQFFIRYSLIGMPVGMHWKAFTCCSKSCSTRDDFSGVCQSGHGFPFVQRSEKDYPLSIEYCPSNRGPEFNNFETIYASNKFKRLYGSAFYFEVKVKINEGQVHHSFNIGYSNDNISVSLEVKKQVEDSSFIELFVDKCDVMRVELHNMPINNADIFGSFICFPSIISDNQLPYVYFTKNGVKITGGVLLSAKFEDSFKPFVSLNNISIIYTNFGQDLVNWPFSFLSFKQNIVFYEDEDFKYVPGLETNSDESMEA
ncbi:hypothetical protein Mgra_00000894, partial [Meloidogyne graminicola]